MGNNIYENKHALKVLFITAFVVGVIGIVIGSIYYGSDFINKGEMCDYTSNLYKNLSTVNKREIYGNIVNENLFWVFIMIISSFFRFGHLISFVSVLRKGFITGFCSAATIGVFGIKGILIFSILLIDASLNLILLSFLTSVTAYFSIKREVNKKIIFFLIIFLIPIFCVLGLVRGYLSTTFISFLMKKIV